MINFFIRIVVKMLVWLRYRVRVRGAADVAARGTGGILFLPNHPAIIDPLIVVAHLQRLFRPRPLADADQMAHPLISWFADRVGVLRIADMSKYGADARDQVTEVVERCAAALREGKNVLLYPSGHLYRTKLEDLRGNTAVERILRAAPEIRVVLVRTRGLWGSSFSFAAGGTPNLLRTMRKHVATLLKNLIFFSPRRAVSIELWEPEQLPRPTPSGEWRNGDRTALNGFLERYYNEDAPAAWYVPYTFWEPGKPHEMPEPEAATIAGDPRDVPAATRDLVLKFLEQQTGETDLRFEQRLAQDLGQDSLARAELLVWLGQEFGFYTADVASLQTVGDVVLAARGQTATGRAVELQPIDPSWFAARPEARVDIPAGDTIAEVFLQQAGRGPARAILADQLTGVRSFRDLITAVIALRPHIAALAGERIGILLPASVGAGVAYLGSVFAGKTPVMVNWTTGARNVAHALELTGCAYVLTAGPLVKRIESQGTDLSGIRDKLLYLEELRKRIGFWQKLSAAVQARFSWGALRRAPINETAAILLTSGSEALPKAVPLTHANILANLRDVLTLVELRHNDALLGFLPAFHSFGLAVTTVLPLLTGIRVAYHANPTEGFLLAKMIEAYGATLLVGTPTFLSGILRASQPGQLDKLRLAVTGAEKCPEKTYELFAQRCPDMGVLEGYGITECAPVVSINRPEAAQRGTIGKLLPSVEGVVVDVETGRELGPDETGLLLVRGPNVFSGYLGSETASPFVEHAGRQWYRTGDLVTRDADGVLTFRGRLKRFVKLGGEMISLPAIESVLLAKYGSDEDDGPVLAVEATPSEEHPEIVLFTTRDIDRAAANAAVREADLSALHNVTRVERVETIPTLGTGKTDYQALKRLLET